MRRMAAVRPVPELVLQTAWEPESQMVEELLPARRMVPGVVHRMELERQARRMEPAVQPVLALEQRMEPALVQAWEMVEALAPVVRTAAGRHLVQAAEAG